MKEKVLKFLKEGKAVILIIVGVLTMLATVVTNITDVVEELPSKDTIVVDSVKVDTIK